MPFLLFLKALVRAVGILVALVISAVGVYFWWLEKIHLDPGRFHREQMNAIVEEIRHRQFEEQSLIWFHINDFNNPKSITRATDLPINIWAMREADGNLKVSIMTAERGHLGDYGFAYSNKPMTAAWNVEYGLSVDSAGQMRHVLRKIDNHWWAVVDNTR